MYFAFFYNSSRKTPGQKVLKIKSQVKLTKWLLNNKGYFLKMRLSHGLTYPLSISSIGRSFDINKRNKANSYFFAIIMLINIVVPTAAGALIDHIGFRNVMVFIVPIIIILFILARKEVRLIRLDRLSVREAHL